MGQAEERAPPNLDRAIKRRLPVLCLFLHALDPGLTKKQLEGLRVSVNEKGELGLEEKPPSKKPEE
jgi:hypothetical protein